MSSKIKLTKDMSVYANDDKKVGDVRHVVLDPLTNEVTHLVVEQGFILTEDKVLPIEFVIKQDRNSLYLNRSSETLDLPPYKETYYVDTLDDEVLRDKTDVKREIVPIPQPMYYYPPLTGGMELYGWGLPGRVGNDPMQAVTVVNVPENSIILEEGANVYSRNGDHVGDVYSVHASGDNTTTTHFVISQGLVFKDFKLIPLFWISQVNKNGIELAVSTAQLEKLPSFEPDKA